jgi:hypothetical protein
MHELPHMPNLRHLRRQARELQRSTGDALQAAQHQLARSYGFSDWSTLRRTIEAGELVHVWHGKLLGKTEFEALRDRGETPPPAALVPALAHPNPRVRFNCLGLLDHLADEQSLPAMITATTDPVPRVRRMAVHALGCQRCKASAICGLARPSGGGDLHRATTGDGSRRRRPRHPR